MIVTVLYEGPIAIVTINNPPVNAISNSVRQGLMDAIETTEADTNVRAVILTCSGRTFIAGADVREFDQPMQKPFLTDVILALEATHKPWIAAIHGTALGGGLEIAMGCHYRVAHQTAQLGLPEVLLGLIPGAGGTVRLPRLVGAALSLSIIVSGKPISARTALQNGLVDMLIKNDLVQETVGFAQQVMDLDLPLCALDRPIQDFDVDALDTQINGILNKARGQNSPAAACKAIRNTLSLSAKDALVRERETFLALKDDPQSVALRYIFFAERDAVKIPALKGVAAPSLEHIGVVGGGTMGAGIAASCLMAGLRVTVIERNQDALLAGQSRIADILATSAKRGLLTAGQQEKHFASCSFETDYAALAHSDLVIEAVFEDMDVKHQVFHALETVTKSTAILASNTSYLDINLIAEKMKDPSRVIGLHFFSPAHVMKLLELVLQKHASDQALAAGTALGKRLGKIVVPAGICDGFIGNRIMSAYRRSCDYMLEDGALPHQIDAAMREFGFPMGIFEMQDLAGLDISWAMRKRRNITRDPTERYVDIADHLCAQGRFGRKAGRGWYLYDDAMTATDDPEVTEIILSESARKGITRRSFSPNQIMAQILSVMQSEGGALLAEGIASKASDIDVVMVNGYGFPRWRGGPMYMTEI